MKLATNMGTTDRIIRIVLAVIFAGLYLTGAVSGIFGAILLALGIVFAVTSAISFCPLYLPFKLSTKGK